MRQIYKLPPAHLQLHRLSCVYRYQEVRLSSESRYATVTAPPIGLAFASLIPGVSSGGKDLPAEKGIDSTIFSVY